MENNDEKSTEYIHSKMNIALIYSCLGFITSLTLSSILGIATCICCIIGFIKMIKVHKLLIKNNLMKINHNAVIVFATYTIDIIGAVASLVMFTITITLILFLLEIVGGLRF